MDSDLASVVRIKGGYSKTCLQATQILAILQLQQSYEGSRLISHTKLLNTPLLDNCKDSAVCRYKIASIRGGEGIGHMTLYKANQLESASASRDKACLILGSDEPEA